jgi:hypothetical protein
MFDSTNKTCSEEITKMIRKFEISMIEKLKIFLACNDPMEQKNFLSLPMLQSKQPLPTRKI